MNVILIVIFDIENGNVYTEMVKLDDLSADPKEVVDPRFELDLTVKVRWSSKYYLIIKLYAYSYLIILLGWKEEFRIQRSK